MLGKTGKEGKVRSLNAVHELETCPLAAALASASRFLLLIFARSVNVELKP